MDKTFKISIGDMGLFLFSLIFLLGVLFVFGPCGAKEDGGWMTCHWAGNAVNGIAAVLAVISLAHLLIPNPQIKTGLSIAVIPLSVLACLLPGSLISLCMMQTMRCHAVMRPAVIVCGVLMISAAVLDIILQCRRS